MQNSGFRPQMKCEGHLPQKAKAETVRDFVAASRFPHRKTWKKVTACLGYAFWGIYSIGSIAECNKNTATMLLEALSLGIYLWLPMAVLTNYGSWNQKSIRFPECLWQQKSFWNWCLALYFSWEGMQLRTICAWMSCTLWENK